MAVAFLTTQDSFSCSICLDLLKDPVAIPCGHSFCLGCIKDCWDQDDQKGVYSCPQCRHTFTPRPVLNKNSLIAEMVGKLKKTRLQAAPPAAASPAGSGGVECDFCTGTKHTAVKSCLVCLASFCEAHIQPHYESPAFKKHKLVEASMNLQEKICSLHDKLLEVFCRTDQQCICLLCVMDKHSGHKTVSAAAERAEKQNQLDQNRETCKKTIQQKEKDVQELKKVMVKVRLSAHAAVEDSEKIFTELIQSIERRRSEVKELIRAQEKTELSLAEDLLKKLEQEIADLRRRDADLKQLSYTEDPVQFLQDFQSLPVLPQSTNLSSINMNPQFSIEFLKKMVSEMKQLNGFSKLDLVQIFKVHTVQPVEPKIREEFSKYSCQLTLNPYMVHEGLHLSDGNKKVNLIPKRDCKDYDREYFRDYFGNHSYPKKWCQVLCSEPLSGRCYWEAEVKGNFSIAVLYKDISLEGKVIQSEFGSNNQSWSLARVDSELYFRENRGKTNLGVRSFPSKIGVYVDHSAGILSFYSITDTMTLLHRVQTTFTQPLYAGFGMKSKESSVKICDL
ncbi:E3 ubiquitin-protein ligase TRIM16-like isoform X1 [Astyanax mexicanus]|uniref:E3 ubiquitin-protein ligase TRIM16-like isoform X1 n=1 Tax=Astyanax mexicanus TaxID=7994 RepID=UPI0020CB4819|nr:E3 ubiquitin-protein ligase TRIM16-like isoform X1 [Astyanax mexicanus]